MTGRASRRRSEWRALAAAALACAALVAAGCRSGPPAAPAADPPDASDPFDVGARYVFVFLETGSPDPPPTPEELADVRYGHFANMRRLAEEGVLLLAGPLGASQDGVSRQGVFVFDVEDVADAEWIGETDPAVQAGLLRLAPRAWSSTPALRELLRIDLERELGDEPGAGARPYVLVTTDEAEAADGVLGELVRAGAVLLHGRSRGEHAGEAILALDAKDFEEAEALLPPGPPWTLHEWYATTTLERLPELAAQGR